MAGRPKLTPEEIAEKKKGVLQKIEPYLKGGLSVNKALGEAHIVNSEFYEFMREDEDFREKINQFRNFVPILLNNIIVRELMAISEKQNGNPTRKRPPQKLSKEDKEFLWKFALNSNLTRGEFGERKQVEQFDPEAEIQKVQSMLKNGSSATIKHDDAELLDE